MILLFVNDFFLSDSATLLKMTKFLFLQYIIVKNDGYSRSQLTRHLTQFFENYLIQT